MFNGFNAQELETLKTENISTGPKTFDFFGNGKERTIYSTTPQHLLRRTTNYERSGAKAWTIQGEYIAFGKAGAVWQSYRYDNSPELLAWVNVRTFKIETVTTSEEIFEAIVA